MEYLNIGSQCNKKDTEDVIDFNTGRRTNLSHC